VTRRLHGRIYGKTIELDEDPGVDDGQEVEDQVTIVPRSRAWGEGILRSAEGWVDYPEMEAIMERIALERRLERRPQMGDE
jgi:hypothetical protein